MLNRMLKAATVALSTLVLASCLTGGSTTNGVSMSITDAPVDLATSIPISFAQVQLSGPHVTPFTLNISPASSIDMFQLQGGIAIPFVSNLQVQPGRYTDLRITIASNANTTQSSISLPDGLHVLYIPPSVPSQVDIPVDFTIASGGDVNLTVDFDLRRSIIQDPNDPTKYQLIPSMRAVENVLSGAITGSVASSLITCLTPAVYVYPGTLDKTQLVDEDITAPAGTVQPITTALVGLNQTSNSYNFTAGFLPAGPYTVAFTCQATQDVANQANNITFTSVTHTVVSDSNTSFVTLQ